ncbi:MAG: 5-formyltetrahydrofolate cyclo-ligase [Cyanobacteria bacterium]|nr:5-formyltetrahydrofolate cyclo-ligase [Cyanobacteriota bacterium]MDW8201587.1 5-formyltetrahydrofolate cyclo-ligase [Cyanobacteriota bacterium SKYGB_h_bin112]
MDKAALRRTLLQQRQTLSIAEWRDRSDCICAHLQTIPLVRQAGTILAYFSSRQEPDLSPLVMATSQTNIHTAKRWGFPRCVGRALQWHQWQPGDPLHTGAYGILEPLETAPQLSVVEVDLLLIPAIACDFRGYRLGYGGGFYDRLLSNPAWAAKPAIGITFAFAYLPQLPVDPWDRPLTAVCTDSGCHECCP